jgi:predicted HTH transcriptional regulator
LDIRPSSDEELQELLSRQEDQFLDFKSKRIAPSKLQPHFVALANTDGGEVFVVLRMSLYPPTRESMDT